MSLTDEQVLSDAESLAEEVFGELSGLAQKDRTLALLETSRVFKEASNILLSSIFKTEQIH